ncbi:MAG: hypothetical protein WC222_11570 [Parachlamydiales bacterium]|jgi:hypothetical protein
MNEFESPLPIITDNQAGIELQDKVRQEYKFFGSVPLRKGMILYEITMSTGEIKPLHIERNAALDITTGKPVFNSKAIYNPKCFYIMAINEKNAIRKYNKIVMQAMQKVKQKHETG